MSQESIQKSLHLTKNYEKPKIYFLNFLSLAGFSITIFLTQHYYQVRNGTATFKSYCNLTSQMNCDVVAASRYAETLFGIPISSVAAGWYLGLFLISVIAHNVYWRKEAIRACRMMALLAALASIPYFFIMAFVLKTFCLLCLTLDGVSIFALITTMSLKTEGKFNLKLDRPKWKIFAFLSLGALILTPLASQWMDTNQVPITEVKELVDSTLGTAPVAVKTSSEFPSIGPSNAPITIVEFSDFQCPYCRLGAYAIHSAINSHLGQVRVEYRNFPLDQACNPEVRHSAHPIACEAARVAMCVANQGQFEAIHDELFDKQETFSPGRPMEIAKGLFQDPNHSGLNWPALESCIKSPEVNQIVNRDIMEAISLGIQSTPTFFVNGYKVEGARPTPFWNLLFDRLLQNQSTTASTGDSSHAHR